jgi:aminoglycoside phosphotransferase (APT) family kinase protein
MQGPTAVATQDFSKAAMQQLKRAKVVEDMPQRLQAWLASRIPDARNVELVSVRRASPEAGMSAEIFILIVRWQDTITGDTREEKYVLRAEVNASTNAGANFNTMIAALKLLGQHSDLPIPNVYWAEHDRRVIGGPFCIMQFLDGVVAPDSPPFTTKGWVFDATPEQRRTMWHSGIRFLTRLHQVEWERLGLDFLIQQRGSVSHTETLLNQTIAIYDGAVEGRRDEYEESTIRWLQTHLPADECLRVSWSDSRPGNMLFKDFEMVGALDWEMCTLLNPAYDVSIWLYTDHLFSEAVGIPRLAGMLERSEILDTYERFAGVPFQNFAYYEVMAAFRCHAVVANMIAIWERAGQHLYGPAITVRDCPSLTAYRTITSRHI